MNRLCVRRGPFLCETHAAKHSTTCTNFATPRRVRVALLETHSNYLYLFRTSCRAARPFHGEHFTRKEIKYTHTHHRPLAKFSN